MPRRKKESEGKSTVLKIMDEFDWGRILYNACYIFNKGFAEYLEDYAKRYDEGDVVVDDAEKETEKLISQRDGLIDERKRLHDEVRKASTEKTSAFRQYAKAFPVGEVVANWRKDILAGRKTGDNIDKYRKLISNRSELEKVFHASVEKEKRTPRAERRYIDSNLFATRTLNQKVKNIRKMVDKHSIPLGHRMSDEIKPLQELILSEGQTERLMAVCLNILNTYSEKDFSSTLEVSERERVVEGIYSFFSNFEHNYDFISGCYEVDEETHELKMKPLDVLENKIYNGYYFTIRGYVQRAYASVRFERYNVESTDMNWEQDTDIVMVDTGNSYEGLCEYVGGKYISYTEEHPITMNPFRITRAEYNIEKVGFLKNLVMLIWKGTNGTVTKTEDKLIEQTITEYYENHFAGRIETLNFNSFYEFSVKRIPQICEENHLAGIDLAAYNYLMKDFYKGGNHEVTLNEDLDTTLFDETFIVFEIDSIKDDPLLFPLVTLIIMDLFIQKMRIKKNRKVLVIEEAWKAIASPMMAEYIKYMYKTARKFWASVGVVTQEIQDIVGSPIVKEAIINNSDVVMLLDQSKFRERFDEIQSILGLTEVDCKKIFTINRLENKEGRSFFREVFIRRGQVGAVYGVEEPHECYMTYTTERSEKEALKIYKSELGCNHRTAIEAYCRDWDRSGIGAPLAFAQKVNAAGHVLNLPEKR